MLHGRGDRLRHYPDFHKGLLGAEEFQEAGVYVAINYQNRCLRLRQDSSDALDRVEILARKEDSFAANCHGWDVNSRRHLKSRAELRHRRCEISTNRRQRVVRAAVIELASIKLAFNKRGETIGECRLYPADFVR